MFVRPYCAARSAPPLSGRPSGFVRSFHSHTQDDRGGWLAVCFCIDYHLTNPLSVILSARSSRSFLQSRKATEWRRAAKSRGKPQAARRRDLRTITAKPSSDKRIVSCVETPIMGRGFVQTTRTARSARADASGALRASQGRLFAPKLRMTAGGVL